MAISRPSPSSTTRRSAHLAREVADSSQSESSIMSFSSESDSDARARAQIRPPTTAPVMMSKAHLFEGLPDVANAFVSRHLINSDPDITAKNLRAYARISRAHSNEVAAIFRQDPMREVLFFSTRNALPSLLKEAKAMGQHRVSKRAIAALLEAAPCLYADLSWPVLAPGVGNGKLLRKILSHPALKEIRLDMSGPNDRQIREVRASAASKQSGRATEIEANAVYPSVYKGLKQRKASAPLKIDFIHRRTLNEQALALALENFQPYCKAGPGIYLHSIDLSEPVSKAYHIESGSFQIWNAAPAFLERIAQWIAAADSTISIVRLAAMRLGDASLIQIANAIRESNNGLLREIDLSENRIRKIGAAKLAEALAVNSSLKTLNLGQNQIEDTGASALYLSLQRNQCLEVLHLEGNNISQDHSIWNDSRVTGRPTF